MAAKMDMIQHFVQMQAMASVGTELTTMFSGSLRNYLTSTLHRGKEAAGVAVPMLTRCGVEAAVAFSWTTQVRHGQTATLERAMEAAAAHIRTE